MNLDTALGGIIEFIHTIKKLLQELNDKFAANKNDKISDNEKIKFVAESKDNPIVFKSLPKNVSKQLDLERDSY